MRRKLGQVFLVDRNILRKIVDAAGIVEDEWVLEVGAGKGDLTGLLLERGAKVVTFELDPGLILGVEREFALLKGERFFLYAMDFLKADLERIRRDLGADRFKFVSNIPYYITSPILVKLVENREHFSDIYITLQREVAERLSAKSSTFQYGSLTLFISYHFVVHRLFDISRTCFRPVPKVNSSFIRLEPRGTPPVIVRNERLFFDIIRASFGGRRKKLRNALRSIASRETIAELEARSDISLDRRGETLDLDEFARLAEELDGILRERS
ncbi:MAG: ribosomal RNA small subunit methyltransferase A [Candidatus Hydrothermae bacterium]|nr:ribosomal RNA small subunit methyltransferase A [Candidatus Hydrothermae bacterium]